MNNLTTPEQLEEKGITKVIVSYLDQSKGFKKWFVRMVFNNAMKNEFTIYTWCIFREDIIKMEEKGLCKIEYK